MSRVKFHPPTLESVDKFLGSGLDLIRWRDSEIDDIGTQISVYPLNKARDEAISMEADVDRIFYKSSLRFARHSSMYSRFCYQDRK